MNNTSPYIGGGTLGTNQYVPKVNPLDYPSDKCSNCNNEVFIPGVIFKLVPGIEMGTGTEKVQVPIKVFVCSKCGELSPADKEILTEHAKLQETVKSSNIVI